MKKIACPVWAGILVAGVIVSSCDQITKGSTVKDATHHEGGNMDFMPDEKMRVITIPPFTAKNEKGQNITHLLTATDHHYLIQPYGASIVRATYMAPPVRPDRAYTASLHGQGCDTLNKDYTNKPNPGFTRQLQPAGELNKSSKELYDGKLEQYGVSKGQDDNTKR